MRSHVDASWLGVGSKGGPQAGATCSPQSRLGSHPGSIRSQSGVGGPAIPHSHGSPPSCSRAPPVQLTISYHYWGTHPPYA